MKKIEELICKISALTGKVSALFLLLLLLNVFYDVILRYLFNDVSIGMQELEWHLYASIFLLGISYTLTLDGHVRVDVFYENFSPQRQALVNGVGTILFIIPFALLISWYGVQFAWDSYQLGESSGDPGGLPYRWIIKAMIPLSSVLLIISSTGSLLRSWQTLNKRERSIK
ncbi:MAG: TRAP transporter small permease subunit [Thiotrichales bacterium]|nr:TRAP transporter small permease subunit [Thiotrichales bacterium]MBT3613952.1 TRAP transporter small permease subunit [Thiotrichales bacterium]MBT3752184.1 TRAP transporter small permease subunit [Thiotrichales bacterium]MBT3836892.1 TRAP transporter small permease subunit [Thiotrichales bacterium]MBT4151754.1 TRAP transporter small permease subunit [Thiotrichales bacterium]